MVPAALAVDVRRRVHRRAKHIPVRRPGHVFG
jgi:hypothetical protein